MQKINELPKLVRKQYGNLVTTELAANKILRSERQIEIIAVTRYRKRQAANSSE